MRSRTSNSRRRHAVSCILVSIGSASFATAQTERSRTTPERSDGLGTVQFDVQSEVDQCRQMCAQGAAWLHAGDPRQADRAFFAATQADATCTIAWSGLAFANAALGDADAAARYANHAWTSAHGAPDRVRAWADAARSYTDQAVPERNRRKQLVRGLDRLLTQHPHDLEAQAFLIRQLIDNRDAGIPLPLRTGVDALLTSLLAQAPRHPGHRYRILLWKNEPRRARDAAATVLRELTAAPQPLLEASEVFAQLEVPDAALACLETAYAAIRVQLQRERIAPSQIAGFGRCLELLIRHSAGAGRLDHALAWGRHAIELPAPRAAASEWEGGESDTGDDATATSSGHGGHTATLEEGEPNPTSLAQHALLDVLATASRWDLIRQLDREGYLDSSDPFVRARRYHAQGQIAARTGQQQDRARAMAALRAMLQTAPASLTLRQQRDHWQRCRQYLSRLAQATQLAPPKGNRSIPGTSSSSAAPAQPLWQPPPAPEFALPDRFRRILSLKSLAGKPVVLVFYLGSECAHCIDQLRSFAPLHAAYQKAGIEIVAVSPDSVDGLKNTFGATSDTAAAPFQLVSDAKLSAFRAYGAFHQQDQTPLHGTILISADRRILWQNISIAPFMATRELLEEARRVLRLPSNSSEQGSPLRITPAPSHLPRSVK